MPVKEIRIMNEKSYKRKENFPVTKSNYRISARSAMVICAARLKRHFIDNIAITL